MFASVPHPALFTTTAAFLLTVVLLAMAMDGDSERAVLIEFFNATNGALAWRDACRMYWLDNSTSVCEWQGVACNYNRSSRLWQVVDLSLPSCGLSGTLPPSLDQLVFLQSVRLSHNHLVGSLPQSWGTRLRVLHLGNNTFDGSIPDSWAAGLPNLRELLLHRNALSGTLSETLLGNLPSLVYLDLTGNDFSGTLPAAMPAKMQYLWVGQNEFNGTLPPEWSRLSDLVSLQVDYNEIVGALPDVWAPNMSQLTELSVHHNRLVGTLPLSYGGLVALQTFVASDNNLRGPLPAAYSNLTNMVYLGLNDNILLGTLPSEWANLTSLKYLWLFNNNVFGTLPNVWGHTFVEMISLDLHSNALNGTIPEVWCNMSALTQLILFDNDLSGSLPVSWGALRDTTTSTTFRDSLQQLVLCDNLLSGTLPSAIAELSSLRYLDLNTNMLTGSLPPEMGRLMHLEYLWLYSNKLNGSLPGEWRNLTQLLSLDLHNNSLSGTLPNVWYFMMRLQQLVLHRNDISGPLPTSWGSSNATTSFRSTLQQLVLCYNRFVGTLPPLFAGLVQLRYLDLNTNSLEGPLPPEWGSLQHLEFLWLSNNNLNGSLPPRWCNMSALQSLTLYDNYLSGRLPDSWSSAEATWNLSSRSLRLFNNCFTTLFDPLVALGFWVRVAVVLPQKRCGTDSASASWSYSATLESATRSATRSTTRTRTISEMSESEMKSRTGSPEVLHPELLNVALSADAHTAAEAASVLSVFANGGGAGLLAVQRVLLISAFVGPCYDTSSNGEISSSSPSGSSTSRWFGLTSDHDGWADGHRKAVLGSGILFLLCVAAGLLCVAALACKLQRNFSSRRVVFRESVHDASARLRMPGLLIVPVGFVFQDVLQSSLVLLFVRANLAVGVIGVLCCLVVVALVARRLNPSASRFPARCIPVPTSASSVRLSPKSESHDSPQPASSVVEDVCLWLCDTSMMWQDKPQHDSAQQIYFVAKYRMLFNGCRQGWHWWLLSELLVTVILVLLGASRAALPKSACLAVRWISVVILCASAAVSLAARPMRTRLGQWSLSFGAVAQVAMTASVVIDGLLPVSNVVAWLVFVNSGVCVCLRFCVEVHRWRNNRDVLSATLVNDNGNATSSGDLPKHIVKKLSLMHKATPEHRAKHRRPSSRQQDTLSSSGAPAAAVSPALLLLVNQICAASIEATTTLTEKERERGL